MWLAIRGIGQLASLHWLGPELAGGLSGWLLWNRISARRARLRRVQRVQEELEAYARLDVRAAPEELAGRASQIIAEKSPFKRVAMLMYGAEGRLAVSASVGMEPAMVSLLNAWGSEVSPSGREGLWVHRGDCSLGVSVGMQSFAVVLGSGPIEIERRQVIVVPMWTGSGHLLGALAVGVDGLMSARRSALRRALEPMEALAVKAACSMENGVLAERLFRAERLAGLGVMAGGMAHALNNPLTAVLGFAELIAGTAAEPRIKINAEIIVSEALRMRQTVEALLAFWRPALMDDEPVQMMKLAREMAAECREKLESRGIQLVVQGEEEELLLQKANRHRLRLVLEHLLNNAAQALARVRAERGSREDVIRVSLNHDARSLHVVVSDTGPGFRDPVRVFDPFETEGEAGAGLSICYGIVREHGGTIRAFNLHPHGAAVAIELPLAGASSNGAILKSSGAAMV